MQLTSCDCSHSILFPLSSTISKIFEYRKRKRRKKYLKSVYHSNSKIVGKEMDGILLGKVRSFFFRVAIVATIGSLSLPTISKIFEYRKRKRRKKYLKSVYHSVQLENCWKRGMESYWKRICSFFFNWKRRGEEEMQLTSCDRSHHRFILFPLSLFIN